MNTNINLIGVGEDVVVLKWQDGMAAFCGFEPIVLTKENTGMVIKSKEIGCSSPHVFEYTVHLNNDEIITFKTTTSQTDCAYYEYDYLDSLEGKNNKVPKIDKLSKVIESNEEMLDDCIRKVDLINKSKEFLGLL